MASISSLSAVDYVEACSVRVGEFGELAGGFIWDTSELCVTRASGTPLMMDTMRLENDDEGSKLNRPCDIKIILPDSSRFFNGGKFGTLPNLAATWHGIWYEIMHSKLFQELLVNPNEALPGPMTKLQEAIPRLIDEIIFFSSYRQHICISTSAGEVLVNIYQLPQRNIHVILNGVDDAKFAQDPEAGAALRRKMGSLSMQALSWEWLGTSLGTKDTHFWCERKCLSEGLNFGLNFGRNRPFRPKYTVSAGIGRFAGIAGTADIGRNGPKRPDSGRFSPVLGKSARVSAASGRVGPSRHEKKKKHVADAARRGTDARAAASGARRRVAPRPTQVRRLRRRVRAFQVKRHPGVFLLVAASGPWRRRYAELGSNVKVLGAWEPMELSKFYNALDVFVNPTLRPQGLDLTLIEAMHCGKPVLTPNEGFGE
ncbi:hypothetical protein SO802_020651 [Lithocarpus litseifolius]|uniref:Glycosyl transferase family 1 domain-containing protein n=1 Tax=Lithocarpus litseifolius TaxID=425828 RepID=A0AAW2CG33_9ROSI